MVPVAPPLIRLPARPFRALVAGIAPLELFPGAPKFSTRQKEDGGTTSPRAPSRLVEKGPKAENG
jgi:hypothetical protein